VISAGRHRTNNTESSVFRGNGLPDGGNLGYLRAIRTPMLHPRRRRPAVLATALVTAAVLGGWPAARAAELQPPLADYLVTSWSDRDGVPIGTVYAVAQDASGYLWLGTESGLIRFDGFRFIPATAVVKGALPRTGATAVFVSRQGSLLVGFTSGEVVRIDGLVVQAGRMPAEPIARVDALVEDASGTVWVVAQGRAHRQRDRRWEEVAVDTSRVRILNAFVGASGRLYFTTVRGVYGDVSGTAFEQLSKDFAYAASESRGTGDLWSTHPVYGIVHSGGASGDPLRLGNGYRAIHDSDGNLWVATIGKGLWRVRLTTGTESRQMHVAPAPALPGDAALALFEDRERNIWIGTPTGLHRLTRKPLTPVANAGPILAIEATADGPGIWAGTLFDGLVRFSRDGNMWRRSVHSSPDVVVRQFHRDRAGTLWIGTSRGLGRVDGDRPVLLARTPATVWWLTSDPQGTLWLGDRRRLLRYDRGRLEETHFPWMASPVELGAADREGRLWIAFSDGTIGVLDAAGAFRGVPGLAPAARTVHTIFEDSSGTLWVGASDGLYRYGDDRLRAIQLSSEWPGNQVWAIVEDDQRFLWVNTDLGLLRIPPGELESATDPGHRLQYHFFDGNDGLAGASVEYLRAVKSSDATVWFARGGALTAIEPGALTTAAHAPAAVVQIESIETDRGRLDMSTERALSAGTRRLDFTFSVLHLSPTPRLRFRHRLDGFDGDWRDAGTRTTASYTNLPPGSYRLVVEAYSTLGTFGQAATWTFELPPRLFETRGFRIFAAFALTAIVAVAWWLRTRLVRRQFAAVLAERARVSREIHDTLLQGVLGISLHLDHLQHAPPLDDAENRRRFERLRLQLEAYIRDARQSILDLRSPVLEHRTFEEALNELAARLTADSGLRFSVKVRGKPRECPARVENELLRIAHEAIVNAVRHSGGTSIQVELRFDDDAIVLRVTDDGRGFDLERASVLEPRKFGLLSMRERAKSFGGELSVVTGITRGTDVEAVFPMRAAV
jgi:signal transduction histidine kinase/ligand-binding sensor domain-containing protein